MSRPEATPLSPNARSPFAGCVILILAFLVMIFLLFFSTWALFRQFDQIVKFTGEKSEPVPVEKLAGREADLTALAAKLETFRQGLTGTQPARLALTPAELNLAIAAYPQFKELRETFHVTAVEGDALRIAISFQLNGKPRLARADEPGLTASDPRYLNATLLARPRLSGREVVLEIVKVEVPGATVPPEFIGHMSPYRITERYQADPVLGPLMAKLTSVTLADGAVSFNRLPGEVPPDRISDGAVDLASSRLFTVLGVLACVFLVFVGIIVFIGLRARRTRE